MGSSSSASSGPLLFLFAESRAAEPIVPLDLWRNRTYSASMVSTFFAAFAFFGAIVFLPRWFQVVEGYSPTNSGLAALPLMVGLIFSSIVSGYMVSRTGRYKWLLVGSIVVMGIGTLFMTQLTAETPVPIVWLWMFIVGLGVGPTFSVFTIVIQNAVPFRQLGVATSNLTFFRQIGGTIALAFVGTIFGSTFQEQIGPQMVAAGVTPDAIGVFFGAIKAGVIDVQVLTGVGDMGAVISAKVPALAPSVDAIVQARDVAFSIATAQTFWLGVLGATAAAIAAVAIKEIPLRSTNDIPVPAQAVAGAAASSAGTPDPVSASTALGD